MPVDRQEIDRKNWKAHAIQVIAGVYDRAERSMLESLLFGVRSVKDADCQKAKVKIEKLLGKEK